MCGPVHNLSLRCQMTEKEIAFTAALIQTFTILQHCVLIKHTVFEEIFFLFKFRILKGL